jgi:hypothetical protein
MRLMHTSSRINRLTATTLEIAFRDARPLTPSPRWGEGRDEGSRAVRYGIIVTPSPHPLPFGARE